MPFRDPEVRKAYWRAYSKRRYSTEPDFRAKTMERSKKRDKAKVADYQREWCKLDHAKAIRRASETKHRLANLLKFAEKSSRRRAKERSSKTEPI